jgi:hypothetical protein
MLLRKKSLEFKNLKQDGKSTGMGRAGCNRVEHKSQYFPQTDGCKYQLRVEL